MEKQPDDLAAAGQVRRMRVLVGGRVEIDSAPGRGTRLVARMPVRDPG